MKAIKLATIAVALVLVGASSMSAQDSTKKAAGAKMAKGDMNAAKTEAKADVKADKPMAAKADMNAGKMDAKADVKAGDMAAKKDMKSAKAAAKKDTTKKTP